MDEKVVLIGAGSAVFTRGLVADLIRLGQPAEVALVDIGASAMTVAERLTAKMIEGTRSPLRLSASTDRRELLPGATCVITTIAVGGRRAWEQDIAVPRRYGLNYPVGDTVGPGGTSRALRMAPALVEIAEDVVELAPQALFFNYANPMATNCRAIRRATGAEVIGLCHGVKHVARYLAEALSVAPDHLSYTAVGINHLTWFVELRRDGHDLLPDLHRQAEQRLKNGPCEDNPFSWQLFRLFGAFPAVLDRHVSEFFPQCFARGAYFGRTLGVDAFSIEETIARGDQGFERMRDLALSPDPLPESFFDQFRGEHEEALDILASIRRGSREVYSANLPNRGQVPNLPAECIVESPAVAEGGGLKPIAQPPLPAGIAGTLATRYQWCETVVEAALEGSRDKFVQALLLDGAVDSIETAGKLADDLLAAHAAHLPRFAGTHAG